MAQAEPIPTTSRRDFFTGAFAALAIPTGSAAADVLTNPDAELLQLASELRKAWVESDRLEASGADDAVFNAAIGAAGAVARRMAVISAAGIDGLRAKAIAILWCWSGELDFEFSETRTTDVRLAESIVRDLLA